MLYICKPVYIPKRAANPKETPQKMSRESTSVMVVMNGFANTAGSMRMALAKMGTHAPTIFATITARAMAVATSADSGRL